MGVLSEKLESIYTSEDKYTVLQLLKKFIDAVQEYEAIVPNNFSVHTIKIEDTMFLSFASVQTFVLNYDNLVALSERRNFIPVSGYFARTVDSEEMVELPYGLYYNNGSPIIKFASGYELSIEGLHFVDSIDN